MRVKSLILLLLLSVIFVSCRKEPFSLLTVKDRLTKQKWVMKSCVDYNANQSYNVSSSTIQFKWDGSYILLTKDKQQYLSTWELLNENKYLRIGSNTYRLSYISGKLLSLKYGSVTMFYVPASK